MIRAFIGWACALMLLVAATAAQARQPLGMDGQPEFYQRVLTLPGAVLTAAPGDGAAAVNAKVPVFSIFYVFDRKVAGNDTWLEVGKAADGKDTAWVKAVLTQD